MDHHGMDAVTRMLTILPSRRDVVRGLASVGLAVVLLPDAAAEARKKRKHKNRGKKAKPNAFGCLSVGKPCKNADQCCSGICKGQKSEKQCRAHDAGTCDQQALGLCEAQSPEQVLCGDATNACGCVRTTAGSNICAGFSECADCTKDADCAALGFPPGSACVPTTGPNCAGACEGGTACLTPCGVELPEP